MSQPFSPIGIRLRFVVLPPLKPIINWQNTNPRIRPSERGLSLALFPVVNFLSYGSFWMVHCIEAIPLKTKALTRGKPLTIVCPWQNAIIHPNFPGPLIPDTGSPREDAKRLKTIDWVYWKISSTPFPVAGVTWSSLAGGALRSAQAVDLWPSGLPSGWDPLAKWWPRT